jgi:hypothetical protein
MRKLFLCAPLALVGLVGCGPKAATFVRSPDTTLGRVVVYRNGVAYFERVAQVDGGELRLQVPSDKVDDFLKSLTVVDAATGEPAPIAYPTTAPGGDGGGLIDMKIQLQGASPHRLRLSYVTEAPSWKPSYRLVVGRGGKVNVQGWAIVDNTSGEDWKGVRLGVGSSSAMSFRFDLRSVRLVERETLRQDDLFALAPPMGGAAYGRDERRVVGELTDAAITQAEVSLASSPPPPPSQVTAAGRPRPSVAAPKRDAAAEGPAAIAGLASALRKGQNGQIVVEGFATAEDKDKAAASLDRANRVREQLVRSGLDGTKVVAVGRGEQVGRAGGVRIVEAPSQNAPAPNAPNAPGGDAPKAAGGAQDPIGTSHFESHAAMTVPRGTSAMVSILAADTEGEVVYLYDAESERGNATYPFRAVRVRNPTDSVLESGPVTVFGDGKFIGEGMSEPVPAHAIAFVPFALDRQVTVETQHAERDEIQRIIAVQRGVFSSEIRHSRSRKLKLYNRTAERAVVFVRHTVAPGYALAKAPGCLGAAGPCEKLGSSNVFRIDIEPNKAADVAIEEETPVLRTTDIRSPEGLDMVRVFLSSAAATGPLKERVGELVRLHGEAAKIEQQIATTREQMQEYRVRMDELHAQLVTLKAVRTAGPLMTSLEKKMQEVSDKLSKATVEVVNLQEKLMVARVHFQEGVAELSLEKGEK